MVSRKDATTVSLEEKREKSDNLTLAVSGITKSFGNNKVLRGVSFTAKSGDIIGLVGKSGCGKSTLLKILVGWHPADTGTVLMNGENITKDPLQLRRVVGYTTQDNSFYAKQTALENMRYYAGLYGVKDMERLDKLLKAVGLWDPRNTLSERISGGMKRRLDFAISLVHEPKLLILDEPTAGLDPLLIEQFWGVVKKLGKDRIVIMSSHIISEIERYCGRALILKDGAVAMELSGKKLKGLEKEFRRAVA
ncbi:hypothetical protein AUJ68_06840 [Candidatus Woesearchaeota archaeon CG1_02_57_44]|nr:MAG: hypothetical protein AUJ68_06840 [Candidatus Woesearchaeota archaeon CG1_02_57_44]PIN69325.1 MAG: hypothetical protein COV94_03020 [Candidatus Woesearchaeota archaeon CG11_big_fil_rev_8_21_14_0_20_57_5]